VAIGPWPGAADLRGRVDQQPVRQFDSHRVRTQFWLVRATSGFCISRACPSLQAIRQLRLGLVRGLDEQPQGDWGGIGDLHRSRCFGRNSTTQCESLTPQAGRPLRRPHPPDSPAAPTVVLVFRGPPGPTAIQCFPPRESAEFHQPGHRADGGASERGVHRCLAGPERLYGRIDCRSRSRRTGRRTAWPVGGLPQSWALGADGLTQGGPTASTSRHPSGTNKSVPESGQKQHPRDCCWLRGSVRSQ